MAIRLLAIDLDDTLLKDDLSISPYTLKVIEQVQARGVMVAISTGRMPRSAQNRISQLKLNFPIIACHGALIKENTSGEFIWRKVIDKDLAKIVLDKITEEKLYCQIYRKDDVFVQELNEWSDLCYHMSGIFPQKADFMEVLENEPDGLEKIITIGNEERILQSFEHLHSIFKDRIYVTMSKPIFIEMINVEANKGTALKYLAEHNNIPREEIMAIGDGLNDVEMIEYAGIGVAMGNADLRLKEKADYITASNEEEGVALAIEEFVL